LYFVFYVEFFRVRAAVPELQQLRMLTEP